MVSNSRLWQIKVEICIGGSIQEMEQAETTMLPQVMVVSTRFNISQQKVLRPVSKYTLETIRAVSETTFIQELMGRP